MAKKLGIKVHCIHELSTWLSGQGTETVGFGKGGTLNLGGAKVTMVNAVHSASIDFGDKGLLPGGSAAGLKVNLERLKALAREEAADGGGRLIDDADFRRKLAVAGVEVDAIEMTEHRVMAALSSGKNPGPASSMLKTQGTEAKQRLDEIAVEGIGYYAAVSQPEARKPRANTPFVGPEHGLTNVPSYLNNRAASIYGGSNEVQRGIIGRSLLGV